MSRNLVIALLVAGTVAAAGCGDGSDVTGIPGATEQSGGTVSALRPTQDADRTAYQSFHYIMNTTFVVKQPGKQAAVNFGVHTEGNYVAPDSFALINTISINNLKDERQFVIVGDDVWYTDSAAGPWTITNTDDSIMEDLLYPGAYAGTEPESLIPTFVGFEGLSEQKNGVLTWRCQLSKDELASIGSMPGGDLGDIDLYDNLDVTIWIDQVNGGLVRSEGRGTARPEIFSDISEFEFPADASITLVMIINLTRINDPEIRISPPGPRMPQFQ